MSVTSKIIVSYSKAFLETVLSLKTLKFRVKKESLPASELKEAEEKGQKNEKVFVPDIFIVGEELLLIRSISTSCEAMREFFNDPTVLEKRKFELILELFPGLTKVTIGFLRVLRERNHLYLIPAISETYNIFLSKVKNSVKIKIIVAGALEESFGQSLLNSLRKLTKAENVILNAAYSPKLLGGFVLEYKSMAIDASVLKEFSLFF